MYYTITQETFYSADYETTGVVREKEFKLNKWHLEIEYKDSERNERVDKREVSEGFLGKRFLYSTILEVLDE